MDIKNGKNYQNWVDSIKGFFNENKKANIKIIVLFFKRKEKGHYGPLKAFITNELSLPSQVIVETSVRKKDNLPIMGKIGLQMNAKLNLALWCVKPQTPRFKDKRIMVGALATSRSIRKDKKGQMSHALSLVGNISKDFSQTYCNNKMIRDQN